jgi:O-antigen/teichoic acid export membrane protein
MLIWIDNLDIGLGNGLRNQLATHLAHDDTRKAREAVTCTFVMLGVIIIPIMLLAIAAAHYCDLYSFMNVDHALISNLEKVVIVSIIFVCSTFIFKFIGNFYLGLQLPAVNNLLITIGHTLALVGTCIVYYSGSHSLMWIAVVNTCGPLLAYLMAYPYTFYKRYPHLRPSWKYFNKNAVAGLFTIGIKFFLLQISGILLFMSSNILISKLFNPAMVTPYQIAYRYFTIAMMIFTIISAPYWTATTDAYERGDMAWIRQSRRRLDKILLAMTTMIAVMVVLSQPVYKVWIGGDIHIPFLLSVLMAVYICMILYSLSYSYYLNGMGALTLQLIMTVGAAVVFIPLTYLSTHVWNDINSVVLTMIAVNLPGLIVNMVQYKKIMNGTAIGIWRR